MKERAHTWKTLQAEGHQLASDTSSLILDTISIVEDLEDLKELIQRHWIELVLDLVCCVCCCGTDTTVEPEEIRKKELDGPRYLDFRKEPDHEYLD